MARAHAQKCCSRLYTDWWSVDSRNTRGSISRDRTQAITIAIRRGDYLALNPIPVSSVGRPGLPTLRPRIFHGNIPRLTGRAMLHQQLFQALDLQNAVG